MGGNLGKQCKKKILNFRFFELKTTTDTLKMRPGYRFSNVDDHRIIPVHHLCNRGKKQISTSCNCHDAKIRKMDHFKRPFTKPTNQAIKLHRSFHEKFNVRAYVGGS